MVIIKKAENVKVLGFLAGVAGYGALSFLPKVANLKRQKLRAADFAVRNA
ncbi:MAG: hypothetical protein IIW16_01880 [Clostridia bacterium]|nr:hypothetical protein [Clostridia bacterium]MBQ5798546.1 hypothetical protein [Clostridia bacterium]MEE1277777.1 hypothetical protein [Acutalibacteraceae bacterium]